jgi:hypothetical protein
MVMAVSLAAIPVHYSTESRVPRVLGISQLPSPVDTAVSNGPLAGKTAIHQSDVQSVVLWIFRLRRRIPRLASTI